MEQNYSSDYSPFSLSQMHIQCSTPAESLIDVEPLMIFNFFFFLTILAPIVRNEIKREPSRHKQHLAYHPELAHSPDWDWWVKSKSSSTRKPSELQRQNGCHTGELWLISKASLITGGYDIMTSRIRSTPSMFVFYLFLAPYCKQHNRSQDSALLVQCTRSKKLFYSSSFP